MDVMEQEGLFMSVYWNRSRENPLKLGQLVAWHKQPSRLEESALHSPRITITGEDFDSAAPIEEQAYLLDGCSEQLLNMIQFLESIREGLHEFITQNSESIPQEAIQRRQFEEFLLKP